MNLNEYKGSFLFNPIRTGGGGGGGGCFHQFRGYLPITLEAIKVHSRNVVNFLKFNVK